ncbi:MAG TPA: CvpA family protein, partial [Chitinophagaceae bacterium]|nr:CvpA family protein [Chitinophagaceae bacterium]
MNNFNIIDLLLLLIVFFSMLGGWRRGFVVGLLGLVVWIGSILAGLFFYHPVANLGERYIPSLGVWTVPLAFLLVLILARILLGMISTRIIRSIEPEAHQSTANKALGLLPGFINGVINATIVAALLLALPLSDSITTKTRDSAIAGKLATQVEWIDEKFSPIFDDVVNRS